MDALRAEVISAFRPDSGYTYSHVLPFRYTNFIDGMAWVGILAGAARMAGDTEVQELAERYLANLTYSHPDARNFAPANEAPEGWVPAARMPGFSVKVKPQAFAGPAAMAWAMPNTLNAPIATANALVAVAPLFGYLVRFIPALRQHVNSVMFAHLLLRRQTPGSLKFLEINNPVYQYIGSGVVKDKDFIYPNTGPWPAKDWGQEPVSEVSYTPLCSLVGYYFSQFSRLHFSCLSAPLS